MTETPNNGIGIIVAAHGNLANILVETVELILGRRTTLAPFAFPDIEKPKESLSRLRTLIKKCDQGKGVIILADLFGGTPGSLALSMLDGEFIEVATGVNLPMAIAAANLDPSQNLHEANSLIVKTGKNAIKEAGKLLKE